MPINYIVGELVVADISNASQDLDVEGQIIVLADQPKQKTYFNISVPVGLMETIMPQYWSEYVTVEVENTIDMYLFRSIDFAEDEYLRGFYSYQQFQELENGAQSNETEPIST